VPHTPNLRLIDGSMMPTNFHSVNFISDGTFAAFETSNRWWIARVQCPAMELITFKNNVEPQLIRSHGNRVHIFVTGQPEDKPRPDHWAVLKQFEYEITENHARLTKIQDFPFSWSVLDFDPATGLALVSSWSTYFAHAILVDTISNARKDLSRSGGHPYFLRKEVAAQFEKVVSGKRPKPDPP
jgi:hypothetical protein